LDLAWFVLWNDHTPSEAWLSDGDDAMCLLYYLQMVSSSLSLQILTPSEVWTSIAEMEWAIKRWSSSEVRTSVADMNWAVRRWPPSEVGTSVTEMNWVVRRWPPSEVRTSVVERNCLDGCPTGRGKQKGAWRLMLVLSFSSGGFPYQITHKHMFSSEVSHHLQSWLAISIGMSLLGTVTQLRMSLWNLEIGVCTMIFEWGLPSSEHRQTSSSPIGEELYGW